MKIYKTGLSLIIAGFIIFIIFGFIGIARVGIFLVFPFIVSNNALSVIPALIIFTGFIILFVSPSYDIKKYNNYGYKNSDEYDNAFHDNNIENNKYKEKKSGFGGIVMIGPVPIIFGDNKKLVYISMIMALIIILIYVIFIYHLL